MNPMQILMGLGNPNQLLQLLSKNNPQLNQMIQTVQNSKNPMQILQNQFGNNPAFQQAMKVAEGKSSEELQQFVNNMLNNNINNS